MVTMVLSIIIILFSVTMVTIIYDYLFSSFLQYFSLMLRSYCSIMLYSLKSSLTNGLSNIKRIFQIEPVVPEIIVLNPKNLFSFIIVYRYTKFYNSWLYYTFCVITNIQKKLKYTYGSILKKCYFNKMSCTFFWSFIFHYSELIHEF